MKVCILSNDDPAAFQSSINAFIADKKVIDICFEHGRSVGLIFRSNSW